MIVGAEDAFTVTRNVQEGPSLLVQVTWVVPTGKVDPDGGSHVTVPQLPVDEAAA